MRGAGGPLRRVVAALEAGASTRRAIAERSGLAPELVDLALDQLQRLGRLDAQRLAASCPGGGCRSCPAARADGSEGCALGPDAGRGPIALVLRSAPPERS